MAIAASTKQAGAKSGTYLWMSEKKTTTAPVNRYRASVPRLGGLALFLGIFVPALAFLDLSGDMRGLLLGAAVATTVGAIDDFRGLTWWEKLGGQVIAASIPAGFGIWVHEFTFPLLGVHVLPFWVGGPLTVVGIVAVMNMVNFLDGLDGLAAGVCGISVRGWRHQGRQGRCSPHITEHRG